MFSQLFGRYLVDQEVITDDELRGMIQKQGDEKTRNNRSCPGPHDRTAGC